jgi:hypothetical protein
MSDIQSLPKQISTRRKLIAGIGVLSLFPILKLGWFNKKKEIISCAPVTNAKTIKFLTQDGTLVEVDASKINMGKEKISNKQLQSWVKTAL